MNGLRAFIDTAFVQALFNRADQHHARASQLAVRLPEADELWTTEAVLVEIGNALSSTNRRAAVEFIEEAYQTPEVHVVSVDTEMLRRALELDDRLHFIPGHGGAVVARCVNVGSTFPASGVPAIPFGTRLA
jgi:predicted nucleic acid-binding protein